MIYTKYTKLAMNICYQAHKDQLDRSGVPYVFHPLHLAEQMQDEDTAITALLHDVIEDSDMTIDDLRRQGFSEEVLSAVEVLTHDPNMPYFDYIEKVKTNPIAVIVKREDLKHNGDLTRLDNVTAKDIKRMEKYKKALEMLED